MPSAQLTAVLSGVLASDLGEARVEAAHRRRGERARRAHPDGLVVEQDADIAQRPFPVLQQPRGGRQHPLTEGGGGGGTQRTVDHFDQHHEFATGHVGSDRDGEMGQALQRMWLECRTSSSEFAAGGQSVQRKVLVHEQGVEHLPHPAECTQLSMPQIAVFAQQRRVALHFAALPADAGGWVEPYPHRHGVDEQADHGLHARQFGRPAGHRDPEDHVEGVGEPGQHQRPCHLHQRVEGDAT